MVSEISKKNDGKTQTTDTIVKTFWKSDLTQLGLGAVFDLSLKKNLTKRLLWQYSWYKYIFVS